ncbi:hypothetical protein TARUN_1607 [Trichoderma arundinaceum]|uniref:Uncharacterized protein n=1 Tax=Trichoderma arundinaceum TaxID=490622 RepID=A0A395NX44_TRIAR|nr:hypothetical protein TARUN_1607 [Trichoderma arundinaceum]
MPHRIRNKSYISLSASRSASFLGTPPTHTPLRQSFRRGGNTGIQNNEKSLRFSSCASPALHGFQKWNLGSSIKGGIRYSAIRGPDKLKLKITFEMPIIEGQREHGVRITCSQADNKALQKAARGILEKARSDTNGGVAAGEIEFFSTNPLPSSGANEKEASSIMRTQSPKEISVDGNDGTRTEGDGGGEGRAESRVAPKKRTRKGTRTSVEAKVEHDA